VASPTGCYGQSVQYRTSGASYAARAGNPYIFLSFSSKECHGSWLKNHPRWCGIAHSICGLPFDRLSSHWRSELRCERYQNPHRVYNYRGRRATVPHAGPRRSVANQALHGGQEFRNGAIAKRRRGVDGLALSQRG
jgi:hypothetical protein